MISLESREEMPASKAEVAETLEAGINVINSGGPKEVLVDHADHVRGIVLKKCLRTIDPETGRFSPVYDENVTKTVECDQIVFAIGQAIEWGKLLDGTKVEFWHGNYPVADKFTYQTAEEDIFVGGDVYTGPKFVIDAIAAGHEAAESLHRYVRPKAHMTIGRNKRAYTPLNKDDITFPDYDHAGRQEAGMDESEDHRMSYKDLHGTLTAEQVATETARCLSCGASYVDPNKCIGCGLCTTKCQFDAIHLIRDNPKCSEMKIAEDKVTGLMKYELVRVGKIILNSGSEDAKIMREKRKEWKKAQKGTD
jgi:ferredoxin